MIQFVRPKKKMTDLFSTAGEDSYVLAERGGLLSSLMREIVRAFAIAPGGTEIK